MQVISALNSKYKVQDSSKNNYMGTLSDSSVSHMALAYQPLPLPTHPSPRTLASVFWSPKLALLVLPSSLKRDALLYTLPFKSLA